MDIRKDIETARKIQESIEERHIPDSIQTPIQQEAEFVKRERDKRSYEMRAILQKAFPKNKFRIKIDKYSMGESIDVYTDLLKPWTSEDGDNQWKRRNLQSGESITPEMQATEAKQEYNKQMEDKIESLLSKFWHIDRDEMTGEILAGGNTYIDIHPLPETPKPTPTTVGPVAEEVEEQTTISEDEKDKIATIINRWKQIDALVKSISTTWYELGQEADNLLNSVDNTKFPFPVSLDEVDIQPYIEELEALLAGMQDEED